MLLVTHFFFEFVRVFGRVRSVQVGRPGGAEDESGWFVAGEDLRVQLDSTAQSGTLGTAGFLLLLLGGVRFWRTRHAEGTFREIDDGLLRPLGLMAMALVWWAGLNLLGLPAGVLVVLLVSVSAVNSPRSVSVPWGALRPDSRPSLRSSPSLSHKVGSVAVATSLPSSRPSSSLSSSSGSQL